MATVPPSGRPRLEIPIFGADSGQVAASLGALRLELNRAGSYAVGGTTPTLAELAALVASIPSRQSHGSDDDDDDITVRVMIRPRGAPPPDHQTHQQQPDFVYSAAEFATMRAGILRFAESGLLRPERGDGFVFGVLQPRTTCSSCEGEVVGVEVDVKRNAELVRLAQPFKCVFHRAFDDAVGAGVDDGERRRAAAPAGETGSSGRDEEEEEEAVALAAVRACGFDGILTSGGLGNALANVGRLARIAMAVAAEGDVEIIAGGGVRSGNVGVLGAGLFAAAGSSVSAAAATAAEDGVWFHSSCLTAGEDGAEMFDVDEASALVRELRSLDVRPRK
ncbi:copper homeostasis CutC domain-containing protein [Lasiosphaeria miniovina]|uniref:Copper homeostasis protein cutC homolog n=1 Tax=Lasiosphaeria miniovina TaxID=1954250 RepID=A0AA40B6E9_9PEZI|nr:copper homeostasis CutC domain-containing protein [Lasiosphaeria miniovina]KAK0728153.1 copper homeostasis CutC domain-containing protein [Lasiosphaeria miniovina]